MSALITCIKSLLPCITLPVINQSYLNDFSRSNWFWYVRKRIFQERSSCNSTAMGGYIDIPCHDKCKK